MDKKSNISLPAGILLRVCFKAPSVSPALKFLAIEPSKSPVKGDIPSNISVLQPTTGTKLSSGC